MEFASYFAALSAQSDLVYYCYDPAARQVLFVSAAYERVLGGQAAQATTELPAWWDALHPDDQPYLREQLTAVLAGATASPLLLRLTLPDGSPRRLRFSASRYFPPAAGPLLAGTVEDVTAEQLAIESAQRYQAKKNSMLEILSHELASPLTLAEQMTDYLDEKLGGTADAEVARVLAGVRRACREGVALVHDFVSQELLDSAALQLNLERQNLGEQLGIVLDNYRQRQHAAGHRFAYEVTDPAIYVQLDNNKFLQVINNLVSNALKFTPDGGLIAVQVSQPRPGRARITVADSGVGIAPTALPHLFERFTPARRPGLRGEKSTGLGMSIVKTIVELHGGHIACASQEGRGTTFTIELPALLA